MSELQGKRWNELLHKRLDDHGFTIHHIKEWREQQCETGRPSGLADFYELHGLCFDCQSMGVKFLGERDDVGIWDVCNTCQGTGKAVRSEWKNPISPL